MGRFVGASVGVVASIERPTPGWMSLRSVVRPKPSGAAAGADGRVVGGVAMSGLGEAVAVVVVARCHARRRCRTGASHGRSRGPASRGHCEKDTRREFGAASDFFCPDWNS